MTEIVSRSTVERFFALTSEGAFERVAEMLADDVVYFINGPVDVLPYCGVHRGKAAVVEMLTGHVRAVLGSRRKIKLDFVMADGCRGAALGCLSGKTCKGQSLNYRVAQFVAFRDGKVHEYRAIFDTFDAVEQVTGHRLGVAPGIVPNLLPVVDADEDIIVI